MYQVFYRLKEGGREASLSLMYGGCGEGRKGRTENSFFSEVGMCAPFIDSCMILVKKCPGFGDRSPPPPLLT